MPFFREQPPLHTWHPHEALYPASMVKTARIVAIVPYLAGLLGLVLFFILLNSGSGKTHTLQPATVFYVLPLFVTAVVGWLLYFRIHRRARKHTYALCLRCGRTLDKQRPQGQCSGCNTPYTLSRVQWAWQRACEQPTTTCPPINPDPETFPETNPSKRSARFMPDRFGHVYLPRAFRRSTLGWGLSIIAVLATLDIGLAVTSHAMDLQNNLGLDWFVTWSLVYLALLVCSIILMAFLLIRWKKRVRVLDGDLCLACGQQLLGLPNVAQCPECGQPYNREANKSIWKAFDRSTKPWFLRFGKNA
ncbi:MAG: hypothetical protein P8M22_10335 [Phycisphaerales bacterium]|nr:hypothetical protein [Phycisphaerales bacterium]